MKKLFLLLITLYCSNLWAQDTTFIYGEGVTPEVIALLKEKANYKATNNRLFSEQKYDSIIAINIPYLNRDDYKTQAKYNLIAAYYFSGNELESKKILNKLFEMYQTPEATINIFTNNSILGLKTYLEIKENKEYIEQYIETKYEQANYPETEIGLQLIRFYINDQWTRRNSSLKYKTTADSLAEEELFMIANDSIYHFYQIHNRLFNKNEVGERVSDFQKMLLWHMADQEQRAFLLPLVKKAVQQGDFPVKLEVDFILRSEYFEKRFTVHGEYFNKRVEELKKEYNLTKYTFFPW